MTIAVLVKKVKMNNKRCYCLVPDDCAKQCNKYPLIMTKKKKENHNLYDWLFWFNTYNNTWYAFKKGDSQEFWNTDKTDLNPKFLKARNVEHLIDAINNPNKISK